MPLRFNFVQIPPYLPRTDIEPLCEFIDRTSSKRRCPHPASQTFGLAVRLGASASGFRGNLHGGGF